MTTIDNKGLNAIIPADGGDNLRIRVLVRVGKTNGKGVWLSVNRDEELSAEIPENGKNIWLLERPGCSAAKTAKILDVWSRKINVHARRIASYFDKGDTESIKRLINTI